MSPYWQSPHDPVSTRPSRITGTMDEWDAWVAGLTRQDKNRLYPGMHTSLIAATEKITGMDEGEYPGYVPPGNWAPQTNANLTGITGITGVTGTTGVGTPSQPKRKLGLLDRSYVKPAEVQNPWTDSVANTMNAITGGPANAMDAMGNTAAPEAYNYAALLSGVAGDTLDVGTALAGSYGGGDTAGGKNTKPVPLPKIGHPPGSDIYTYNDPQRGTRNVTPFEDEIPGFDWHRDRNMFNLIPGKVPEPVRETVWITDYIAYDEVTHFVDHMGSKWYTDLKFVSDYFHGQGNLTLRGEGRYKGCQAVYSQGGGLIKAGSNRGTYDYFAPGSNVMGHFWHDVVSHVAGKSDYRNPDLSQVY